MLTRQFCGTALIINLLILPAAAQQGTPPPTSAVKPAGGDTAFLTNAFKDGETEIALADLALSKSQNADVKALAAKIKSDHQQADDELKRLAGKKSLTLPSFSAPAGSTSRLEKLSGAEFDKAYVNAMVTDHKKAIDAFTKASKSSDADVKAFADKTLPALREHLQRAEQSQKKNGK